VVIASGIPLGTLALNNHSQRRRADYRKSWRGSIRLYILVAAHQKIRVGFQRQFQKHLVFGIPAGGDVGTAFRVGTGGAIGQYFLKKTLLFRR